MAVSDNERRTVVGFRGDEGLDRVRGVSAEGDLTDEAGAVGDRHHAEVFFTGDFTAGGELSDGALRSGLRRLTAGVGVNFGVEDEDVDVVVGGDDVIETAVTDIVSPTVAADDPLASAD